MGKGNADKIKIATAAALLSNFIFGLSFMFSRIALEHTSSSIMLALRFGASVVIMLLLAATGVIKLNFKGKNLRSLFLLGLFQPIIYFIGEANGIRLTNSSFAGIMISLIPVVTAIGSGIFLNEKVPGSAYGWILCSVAGVAVISLSQAGGGAVQPAGILFLVLAVTAGAGFTLLSRSMADEFTAYERTFVMMVMGFVFFTASAVILEGRGFAPILLEAVTDKYVIFPVLYLSIASSVMAFAMLNYAVTYLDAARATVFTNLIPVISLLAGVLILGEPFSAAYLLGIILILAGVYKVNTTKTPTA
ncbi:MAG: DMT family transporter [Mogibacterium sp.]|nr:DMT family transporter [Mogibacterium sp.]